MAHDSSVGRNRAVFGRTVASTLHEQTSCTRQDVDTGGSHLGIYHRTTVEHFAKEVVARQSLFHVLSELYVRYALGLYRGRYMFAVPR